MTGKEKDGFYTDAETAKRRDEVVRRMANTTPQPKTKPSHRLGKKKKAVARRAVRRARAGREA